MNILPQTNYAYTNAGHNKLYFFKFNWTQTTNPPLYNMFITASTVECYKRNDFPNHQYLCGVPVDKICFGSKENYAYFFSRGLLLTTKIITVPLESLNALKYWINYTGYRDEDIRRAYIAPIMRVIHEYSTT